MKHCKIKDCTHPTIEDVDYYWGLFDKYKETAEQYEFVTIAMWDMRMVPLYKDLKNNWDENHAKIFLKGMALIFERFGIKE